MTPRKPWLGVGARPRLAMRRRGGQPQRDGVADDRVETIRQLGNEAGQVRGLGGLQQLCTAAFPGSPM